MGTVLTMITMCTVANIVYRLCTGVHGGFTGDAGYDGNGLMVLWMVVK